jgi:iron only hydrogenase large subunit-like protein
MPCYDKKLEASRQDFYNELYSTRDVDCVITTGELDLIMREKAYDLSRPADDEDSWSRFTDPDIPDLIFHPGTSSGSYLHAIISFLTSISTESLDLSVHSIRTSDYEEYILRKTAPVAEDDIVFRGAKCYGFRNLQNVVRKVGKEAGVQVGRGAAGKLAGRRGKGGRKGAVEGKDKGYDYVEVMACPGGCVNGGGQLRPRIKKQEDEEGYGRNWEENGVKLETGLLNAKWGDKEWIKKVESAYWQHDLPTPPPSPTIQTSGNYATGGNYANGENYANDDVVTETVALRVFTDLCQPTEVRGDKIFGVVMDAAAEARRRSLFRTQYRAVESEVLGLAVKW